MLNCPACNSEKVTKNERGDKRCLRCGWIHKEGRQNAVFTIYSNESEIDKVFKRMGLE